MAPTTTGRAFIAPRADIPPSPVLKSTFPVPPIILSIILAVAVVLVLFLALFLVVKIRNWCRRSVEDEEKASLKACKLPRKLLLPSVLSEDKPVTFLPSASRVSPCEDKPRFVSVPVGVHVKRSTRWFETNGSKWNEHKSQDTISALLELLAPVLDPIDEVDDVVLEVHQWIQSLAVVADNEALDGDDIPDIVFIEPSMDITDMVAHRASIQVFDALIGSTLRQDAFLEVPNKKRKDDSDNDDEPSASKRPRLDMEADDPFFDTASSYSSCESVSVLSDSSSFESLRTPPPTINPEVWVVEPRHPHSCVIEADPCTILDYELLVMPAPEPTPVKFLSDDVIQRLRDAAVARAALPPPKVKKGKKRKAASAMGDLSKRRRDRRRARKQRERDKEKQEPSIWDLQVQTFFPKPIQDPWAPKDGHICIKVHVFGTDAIYALRVAEDISFEDFLGKASDKAGFPVRLKADEITRVENEEEFQYWVANRVENGRNWPISAFPLT